MTDKNFEVVERRSWQVVAKNSEDEPQVFDLEYTRSLPEENEQSLPFITQAKPTKITPSRAKPKQRDHVLIASIPDIQYGWRHIEGDEYVALHDERAMKVARFILKDLMPDIIVFQGDNLDLPTMSKYEADSNHFVDTLQMSIDGLHRYYAELRADNPNAKMVEIDSNHNARLGKYVLRHAAQLYGLKRANMPEEWSVVTYPFLLRLDELGIEWKSGYPAAEYHYEDRLSFIHGDQVRSKGSTAELYARERDINTVFGHVHRMEMHTRTTNLGRHIVAITFGTLARTDGAVPSYGSAVDDRGRVVEKHENWQQGIGIIRVYEDDIEFQPIRINQGKAYFQGKEYKA